VLSLLAAAAADDDYYYYMALFYADKMAFSIVCNRVKRFNALMTAVCTVQELIAHVQAIHELNG